jgi:hypothetical protein
VWPTQICTKLLTGAQTSGAEFHLDQRAAAETVFLRLDNFDLRARKLAAGNIRLDNFDLRASKLVAGNSPPLSHEQQHF